MENTAKKLLPCPFCGCERIRILPQAAGFSVNCEECYAYKVVYSRYLKSVETAWNSGCLIDSERAVEGESIIKYENSYRKEIYTPYYCQIHAPGKLAKVTEKDIIEIHRRYQVELTTLRNKYVKLEDKYKKLIMAVPYECAGETRFERALRYIKQYQILVDKEITPVTEIQKEKE